MFDAVPIVTTKEITENAQKKQRKESKCVTTKKKKKNQNTKDNCKRGKGDKITRRLEDINN